MSLGHRTWSTCAVFLLFVIVTALGFAAAPKANPATEERKDPLWERAHEEVYKSVDELNAQHDRELRHGKVLAKIMRGDPRQKILALTFDDGPHPQYTPRLLEILDKEQVKATFFVIGKMVERNPDLARAIVAGGHTLGNHTFSHVTLTKIPLLDIATEYQANNDVVQRVTGVKMRFCRPPGGDYDSHVIDAANALGLTTVLWTDDPGDYAQPGDPVVLKRTLSRLSNGGIILLHDGVEQTLDVLPKIIASARARGFRFVSLDELARSIARPRL